MLLLHFGLDAIIDLTPDQAGNKAAQLLIFQEFDDLVAVAIRPVQHELFEFWIENISEVVERIRLARIPNGFIHGGVDADLLPEEFVGGGELCSKALVQHLHNTGEWNLLVLHPARPDIAWPL